MKHLIPEQHTPAILIILTLFAVIGPVSIDIFTPSLPAITAHFDTVSATSHWSVGVFMLGFSVSMLICGPLADRYGRKKTLLGGYIVYLLATFVALNTSDIYAFIGARFVQAVFGCFGTAIARTIARDYYRDENEVRMLAYIGGCLTIAPMIAPIAGGFIQEYAGWHMNFMIMGIMALLAMGLLCFLPEKHQPTPSSRQSSVFSDYRKILTDGLYLRFCFAAGAAFSGAFVFVAGGAFVFIDELGLAPTQYGMLFAIAIAAFMISAAYAPTLNQRLSRGECLKLSGGLLIAGGVVSLLSATLSGGQSIAGYILGIALYELGLGIYMPICQARATEHMKENIGTASGLIFFVEMVLATLVSGIIGWLPEAGTTSLAVVTLLIALLSTLSLLSTKQTRNPALT